MQKKILVYTLIVIQFISVLSINNVKAENNIPFWNDEWSYREEIFIPIKTSNSSAIYQPIDVLFEFKNPCWAKDTQEHSIRVLCWDGHKWHELESQIYNIEEIDSSYQIKKCGIVFLIPNIANGNERYFIYYDESSKEKVNYKDHIEIQDSYYYFEPITGISAEGDYYKITEDGFCVFGIGQKGKVIHRRLSQMVIKLKPKTKNFDITKSDNIASFCYSYHKGTGWEDEISSDHELIAKQILVDGNLMVEFKIISQSENQIIRTTNIYKYYYCPTEDKRMNIHVNHEILKDDKVEGIINVDGRYGAIISYQSKSEKIQKMRFGQIFPFLHIYMEDGKIREYLMNTDPEGKNREWIIPFSDDCDLGKKSWFSYDEGETGKAQAIILRSNSNIVKNNEEERDGIQMKVAVNEYMDALGAEIDYAAINFGKNSYEKGGNHDLKIRSGTVIDYDAEFFVTENGGYKSVVKEVDNYHNLIEHRNLFDKDLTDDDQKIYTLTVVPRLTGRIFSNPFLANMTGIKITTIYGELYKDNELISNKTTYKPLIGPPVIKYPKLSKGKYILKMYREIGNKMRLYIGISTFNISKDTKIQVFCTWPKNFDIKYTDQNNNFIDDFEILILKNETIIDKNIQNNDNNTIFIIPQNIFFNYQLIGKYKGFEIINKELGLIENVVYDKINLYDLKINFQDNLNFPPGVEIKPYIISEQMTEETKLFPDKIQSGQYYYNKLPKSNYKLLFSYGSYSDEIDFEIKNSNKEFNVDFRAEKKLNINLLNSNGNQVENNDIEISIYRRGREIYKNKFDKNEISLPLGEYQIRAYKDGKLIGFKDIYLTNNKDIKVVTNIKSHIPLIFIILSIVFIIQISIVFIIKKISLNSFLKSIALALILLSIFLPWWSLSADNNPLNASKNTEMFIYPQIMIEKIQLNGEVYYDLSTIPDLFVDFLAILFYVVISGFILLGLSFIPNIFLKKRYSFILILASFLFLIIISASFIIGMSKLTEISLGSLTGEGSLNVSMPNNKEIIMNGSWGLGIGFYLCLFASIIALCSGIIDYILKKIKKIQL